MKRRKFTEEFKRKAVARIVNGEPIKEVIADLKIHGSMLYNWRRKIKKEARKVKASIPAKKKSPNRVATAIILLRHARDAAVLQITENPEKFDDPVYTLAMMALRELEK